ncbi:MAG: hypothetical protein JW881_05130 [Spirochaetales bacterium]|nr:hypothetical protein [Spirochaetales bacterium]
MRKATSFIITFFVILVFFSCSVRQDISIAVDGSGQSTLSVELKPVFLLYILDLAEAMSDEEFSEDMDIFEIQEIKKELGKQEGVKALTVTSPSQEKLEVTLSFTRIARLLHLQSENTLTPLLTFKNSQGLKILHFHLEKENYTIITELFPILDNPVFQNLAPQPKENISQREYLDIVEFAMGEEGRIAVKKEIVKVTVTVKGTIVSQKGGYIKDGIVYFDIPLLDVLLLSEPLDYEIVFR